MPQKPNNPLPLDFYTRTDVVRIARELLGKTLYTSFDNEITAGIIVETEAYAGITDRASHAFNNRRTTRTETMYLAGGCTYVYLCYGIHSLFNIVTSVQDDPHAVLIRGIEPLSGIDHMQKRTGKSRIVLKDGIGPGNVAKLMGIKVAHSGSDLGCKADTKPLIWVEDDNRIVSDDEIRKSARIGVAYAGEDALLPYRFQWLKKQKAPF